MISGNQIAGNGLAYGILLAASPNAIGDMTLVGNQLRGATTGLYCTQTTAGLFPGLITSTGNRFATIQCPLQTFTADFRYTEHVQRKPDGLHAPSGCSVIPRTERRAT